ncbi:MAG: AI-2E family transporter [Clostridiaceae bacterium]
MKKMNVGRYKKQILNISKLIGLVVLILLFFYFKFIREVFSVIITSFFISYTLRPLNEMIVKKGINKRLSSAFIVFGLIAMVILLFVFFIPSLIRESANIGSSIAELQSIVDNLIQRVRGLGENKYIVHFLNEIYLKTDEISMNIGKKFMNFILSFSKDLLEFSIIPVLVYYFLADDEYIYNKVILFFPAGYRDVTKKVSKDMDKILSKYILSQLILCCIVTVLTFAILMYFRVNFPLVLSILNGIFNIIPYFGPILGTLPCVVVALLKSPTTALYVVICLYIIQQIEGDLISPKITASSVAMHPLSILILLILGGELGGFIGMILAVPLGVCLKIIYDDINYYLY